MHELRSKSMNSSTFSCGVIAPATHSCGKVSEVVTASSTWKSSNSTRPHCADVGAPTGVLNV